MPTMDGFATAEAIRALPLEPPPHLLMITAYGRDDLLQRAEQVGLEAVLVKPVSPSILLDTLMRSLGGRVTGVGEAQPVEQPESLDLSPLGGVHVLLVEDNELNQEVAIELLAEAGLEVDLASDGAIALEMVQANTMTWCSRSPGSKRPWRCAHPSAEVARWFGRARAPFRAGLILGSSRPIVAAHHPVGWAERQRCPSGKPPRLTVTSRGRWRGKDGHRSRSAHPTG
jgi:CheY-like chemotaxis protein